MRTLSLLGIGLVRQLFLGLLLLKRVTGARAGAVGAAVGVVPKVESAVDAGDKVEAVGLK